MTIVAVGCLRSFNTVTTTAGAPAPSGTTTTTRPTPTAVPTTAGAPTPSGTTTTTRPTPTAVPTTAGAPTPSGTTTTTRPTPTGAPNTPELPALADAPDASFGMSCPPGATTDSRAGCKCKADFYGAAASAGGLCTACATGTTSIEGSLLRTDCKCKVANWGREPTSGACSPWWWLW
ncbi:hypothetical protein FOA52_001335 [Chlamydomonas sp. UWO 241]|nr:hypothetical protein FOA52_001335 [Chlamydomonas sp. UWO 241]